MQQKMRKLINFLIIGLIINLQMGCRKESLDTYVSNASIINKSSQPILIKWYNLKSNSSDDSIYVKVGCKERINYTNFDDIAYYKFDSVELSNARQTIVYIPCIDTIDFTSKSFYPKLDPTKPEDHFCYLYTITDSSFYKFADECAKFGQDIWRKK